MNKRKGIIWLYAASDYAAAAAAWYFLFLFRKLVIEKQPFNVFIPFSDKNFWIAILVVPAIWLLMHYLTGTYTDLYRKSRLQELAKTAIVCFVGTIGVFFSLLLDDYVRRYSDYYLTFGILVALQILFTWTGRFFILSAVKRNIWSGSVSFPTLLIGSSQRANELYEELKKRERSYGFQFTGYIETNGQINNTLTRELKELGSLQQLEAIMDSLPELEEVIIAIESSEHHLLNNILNKLADRNVTIRIIPDMYDILSGTVRLNHVIGEAFIEIRPQMLSEWERITKRWFDVLASIAALIISSPVLLYVAIRIWLTDRGSIFYRQERLGQYGKPFYILKFRSMYANAESAGPQLTTENDTRITPIGRIIRKYRIDEFPQFINVIKGEMSIVGPRAERKFFADQIEKRAPYYTHVFRVQPGITSLGMVKYGYASTVDEMIKRLKYDIIYIENMSIALDFKIMIYTVLTVVYGRGK